MHLHPGIPNQVALTALKEAPIIDQRKGFQQKTLLKWTNLSCTITCLGLITKYFSKISGTAMHEFT